MTVHDLPDPTLPDGALVHELLFDWRVRGAARHTAWQLTSNLSAVSLCAALVQSLQDGAVAPQLVAELRSWGAGVPSHRDTVGLLQCLGEAVSELGAREFGGFRPRGLDPVLQVLAQESAVSVRRRAIPVDLDLETGCLDRRALERDLAVEVTGAGGAGDVAMVVMELDAAESKRPEILSAPGPVDESLIALLAVLRQTFGRKFTIYRVGRRSFGVVASGTDTASIGALVLRATCSTGPRFFWGTASLRAIGPPAELSPELLLFVAQADMEFRRRELLGLTGQVDRRHRLAVVGSVAASLLLVAGAATAVQGLTTSTANAPHVALPARATPPPAPAASGPATTVPAPAAPTASPPAAPSTPVAASAPTPAPLAPPPTNVVLTSYQVPASPPTSPPPPPLPPPPPPPPTPTTTVPPHGHSATAPGQLKKA